MVGRGAGVRGDINLATHRETCQVKKRPKGENSFKRFVQISECENPNASTASEALILKRNALSKLMRQCHLDASYSKWPPIASQNKDGAQSSLKQFESCFQYMVPHT